MILVNKNFWQEKNVLITGFNGFLGSHLTLILVGLGAKVIGLDIKAGRKDSVLKKLDYRRIQVIKGDIRNEFLLRRIFKRNKIDIVFHLAAEAIVGKCHKDPLSAFSTNIEGTWKLLESCRNIKNIKSIVIASSDKAYGSHDKLPYKENASLVANHPYDVSKSCADLIANTYFNTYGLPVAVTRCGNIYGPGDFNFSRLVPDAMSCIFSNRVLKIRSDGTFIRDYIYVDDIVIGYIKIAEFMKKNGLAGEAFNLSNEKPIDVIRLLKNIGGLKGYGNKLKYRIFGTAKYEIKKQYLSALKAKRLLGWKPSYSLKEGLQKTAKWYESYFSK